MKDISIYRGDRSSIDAARKVVQFLEEMGHEVLTWHLVGDDAWEADRSISLRTFTGRHDLAATVRSIYCGSLRILLRLGMGDGLSSQSHQQESDPALMLCNRVADAP